MLGPLKRHLLRLPLQKTDCLCPLPERTIQIIASQEGVNIAGEPNRPSTAHRRGIQKAQDAEMLKTRFTSFSCLRGFLDLVQGRPKSLPICKTDDDMANERKQRKQRKECSECSWPACACLRWFCPLRVGGVQLFPSLVVMGLARAQKSSSRAACAGSTSASYAEPTPLRIPGRSNMEPPRSLSDDE